MRYVVIKEDGYTAPIKTDMLIALMKHRFLSAEAMLKANPQYFTEGVADIIREYWDEIIPFHIPDLFAIKAQVTAKFAFQVVGPKAIFEFFEPNAVKIAEDSYEITQWDNTRKMDKVELWHIKDSRIPVVGELYLVRVVCPSTGKKHMLYVSPQDESVRRKDAIGALVSLYYSPVPIEKVECIKRQGEVLYFKYDKKEVPQIKQLYPMNKKQFLALIREQS